MLLVPGELQTEPIALRPVTEGHRRPDLDAFRPGCWRSETLIYTEKPRLRSAKLLSLTMVAAILFTRAFSHGPFPTGGRQRLLLRQGGIATEIRPTADL